MGRKAEFRGNTWKSVHPRTPSLQIKVPKTFDFQRYEPAREFGPLRWRSSLSFRRILFYKLKAEGNASSREVARTILKRVLDSPFSEDDLAREFFDEDDMVDWYVSGIVHFLEPNGVNLVTHRDFWSMASWLWDDWRRKPERYPVGWWSCMKWDVLTNLAETSKATSSTDIPSTQSEREGEFLTESAPLSCNNILGEAVQWVGVDLSSPDDELIEQFKALLSTIRSATHWHPQVETVVPDLDKLNTHAILPYIDLTLWCAAHGGWMTDDEMAKAIYKHRRKEGASVRNVTAKVADQLLDKNSALSRGLAIEARREESCWGLDLVNVSAEG